MGEKPVSLLPPLKVKLSVILLFRSKNLSYDKSAQDEFVLRLIPFKRSFLLSKDWHFLKVFNTERIFFLPGKKKHIK